MSLKNGKSTLLKSLTELLSGGFAPVFILLREFDYKKVSIVLDGLPYSVWSLLGHMHFRQQLLLGFIKGEDDTMNLWPDPYWPSNDAPGDEGSWKAAIDNFEHDLLEMIRIIEDEDTDIYKQRANGKNYYWAALANLQHNAYHIGQIKAIGRQLGVW